MVVSALPAGIPMWVSDPDVVVPRSHVVIPSGASVVCIVSSDPVRVAFA
ncbi:hypothetical protein MNBD_ACTINO01-2432, partial [hydrothermal vent metagenome]